MTIQTNSYQLIWAALATFQVCVCVNHSFFLFEDVSCDLPSFAFLPSFCVARVMRKASAATWATWSVEAPGHHLSSSHQLYGWGYLSNYPTLLSKTTLGKEFGRQSWPLSRTMVLRKMCATLTVFEDLFCTDVHYFQFFILILILTAIDCH